MKKLFSTWHRLVLAVCVVFVVVGLSVLSLPAGSQAQMNLTATDTTPTSSAPTTTASSTAGTITETSTISGTFVAANGNTLNISTDSGVQTLTADNDIVITRDGEPVNLSDLQAGDEVTATVTPTGDVLALTATSSDTVDTASAVWPIVIVLLILIILGFWLWSKSRRDRYRYQQSRK